MSCEHAFLLGTGILPTIFTNDKIIKYLTPPSSITNKPTIFLVNENKNNNEMITESSSYHITMNNLPSIFTIESTNDNRNINMNNNNNMTIEIDNTSDDSSSSSSNNNNNNID